MEFTKPNAFTKQISIYISNADYVSAYNTAKDFVIKFPDEPMAHLLLAIASFMSNKYDIAKLEGYKAFNMVSNQEDMLCCAIIIAMAHYQLTEYEKGYEILSIVERRFTTTELEEMLIIFAIMVDDPDNAVRHYNALSRINAKAAEDLFMRIAKRLGEL